MGSDQQPATWQHLCTTPSKRLPQDPTMNTLTYYCIIGGSEKKRKRSVLEKAKIPPYFYFNRLWSASGSGLCFVV